MLAKDSYLRCHEDVEWQTEGDKENRENNDGPNQGSQYLQKHDHVDSIHVKSEEKVRFK